MQRRKTSPDGRCIARKLIPARRATREEAAEQAVRWFEKRGWTDITVTTVVLQDSEPPYWDVVLRLRQPARN